jgi:response regulator of citrate/malate metabolism
VAEKQKIDEMLLLDIYLGDYVDVERWVTLDQRHHSVSVIHRSSISRIKRWRDNLDPHIPL